jgi:hypothetical protein
LSQFWAEDRLVDITIPLNGQPGSGWVECELREIVGSRAIVGLPRDLCPEIEVTRDQLEPLPA